MRDEAPTEDELREVKNFMIGVFPLRFESTGGVAAAIEPLAVYGLPDDFWQRYRDRLEAVTPADVQRVARELIDPTRSSSCSPAMPAGCARRSRRRDSGRSRSCPPRPDRRRQSVAGLPSSGAAAGQRSAKIASGRRRSSSTDPPWASIVARTR